MAVMRRFHADRYSKFFVAAHYVEDQHRAMARGLAELADRVKVTPRDRILLEIAEAEMEGVRAHMAALRKHLDETGKALMEAIAAECPNDDPDRKFQELAHG